MSGVPDGKRSACDQPEYAASKSTEDWREQAACANAKEYGAEEGAADAEANNRPGAMRALRGVRAR